MPADPSENAPRFTAGEWRVEFVRWTDEAPVGGFAVRVEGKSHSVASAACYEHGSLGLDLPEGFPADEAKKFYTRDEVIANAHLISQAPNLYHALERARLRMLTYGESREEIVEIDEVLAAARGTRGKTEGA